MARVNDALIEVGKDPLTGMRLLKDVLNHRETPLDIRIQCAQILVKEENAPAEEQKYLTIMPPPMPAESTEAQQAPWWSLYGDFPVGDDAELDGAVKTVLKKAATVKRPEVIP
jgi:hypothetical protein